MAFIWTHSLDIFNRKFLTFVHAYTLCCQNSWVVHPHVVTRVVILDQTKGHEMILIYWSWYIIWRMDVWGKSNLFMRGRKEAANPAGARGDRGNASRSEGRQQCPLWSRRGRTRVRGGLDAATCRDAKPSCSTTCCVDCRSESQEGTYFLCKGAQTKAAYCIKSELECMITAQGKAASGINKRQSWSINREDS